MNNNQIQNLLSRLEDNGLSLVETHISWVLLADEFAYKIKKPLSLSFLDFSTLEKRKYYCEREVQLNNRLTGGVYLGVIPIVETEKGLVLGGEGGKTIDYAVKMKRLDGSRQMNLLLEKGSVRPEDMDKLASQLAAFHAFTDIVEEPFDLKGMQEDFADVLGVRDFVNEHIGAFAAEKLAEGTEASKKFLHKYRQRFLERSQLGFIVDGHGDLHSKNIFLLEKPVIFDCIEFNDDLRHLDVLNEIAFFCLDFDYYGRTDLETRFLNSYLVQYPCILTDEDKWIFEYYKLYRANVRLKVDALAGEQAIGDEEFDKIKERVEDYYNLFRSYLKNCLDILKNQT